MKTTIERKMDLLLHKLSEKDIKVLEEKILTKKHSFYIAKLWNKELLSSINAGNKIFQFIKLYGRKK